MESKDELLKKSLEGEAFSGLQSHHGYKALVDLFKALYLEAWEALEEREDPLARAKLNAIKEIVSRIDDKINLSKEARAEYNKIIFGKQTQDTA